LIVSNPFRKPGPIVVPTHRAPTFAEMDFAAPVGRRVRLVTIITVVIIGGGVLAGIVFTLASFPAAWPLNHVLIGALVAVAATGLVAWFSQISRYRLTRDELLVVRRNRETPFPLERLAEATVDPDAMRWSIKINGNDGLGAITGSYWNRRLGRYRALVTDRRRAVVLRWPDRCLVVSPDRPDEFVRAVRARAGLRD
jgi:hypothetical protein